MQINRWAYGEVIYTESFFIVFHSLAGSKHSHCSWIRDETPGVKCQPLQSAHSCWSLSRERAKHGSHIVQIDQILKIKEWFHYKYIYKLMPYGYFPVFILFESIFPNIMTSNTHHHQRIEVGCQQCCLLFILLSPFFFTLLSYFVLSPQFAFTPPIPSQYLHQSCVLF